LKEKYEKIKQLLLEGKCKTEICRSLNMDIRAYDKLMAMTAEKREKSQRLQKEADGKIRVFDHIYREQKLQ